MKISARRYTGQLALSTVMLVLAACGRGPSVTPDAGGSFRTDGPWAAVIQSYFAREGRPALITVHPREACSEWVLTSADSASIDSIGGVISLICRMERWIIRRALWAGERANSVHIAADADSIWPRGYTFDVRGPNGGGWRARAVVTPSPAGQTVRWQALSLYE